MAPYSVMRAYRQRKAIEDELNRSKESDSYGLSTYKKNANYLSHQNILTQGKFVPSRNPELNIKIQQNHSPYQLNTPIMRSQIP